MKAALEHDHLAAAAALARELDRRLVGLRAGVGEEHPRVGGERGREPRREPYPGFGQVEVGGVQEALGLFLDRLDHVWMAVARVADRYPGEEVEIALALGVVERRSLSPHERHRLSRIGPHHVALVQRPEF